MPDLEQLGGAVARFAEDASVPLVPVVPEDGLGPQVRIGPEAMPLSTFLNLAVAAGGGLLYRELVRFTPEAGDLADSGQRFAGHVGALGAVCVAFVANGVVHFWEQQTPWYAEWQEQERQRAWPLPSAEPMEDPDDSDTARLDDELVERIVADPGFRALTTAERLRYVREHHGDAGWEAQRRVTDRAKVLTDEAYTEIRRRIASLAGELVATEPFIAAASPAGRKRVVVQFLIGQADGFRPPADVREELYAQAQVLAKANKQPRLL